MASWEPVDNDPTDRDGIGMEDDKWDDGKINELEIKLKELRQISATLEDEAENLGNINKDLRPPSTIIKELGINMLKLMGFNEITDEDVNPSRSRYIRMPERR